MRSLYELSTRMRLLITISPLGAERIILGLNLTMFLVGNISYDIVVEG